MRSFMLLIGLGIALTGTLAAQHAAGNGVQIRTDGDVAVGPDAPDEVIVAVRGNARVAGGGAIGLIAWRAVRRPPPVKAPAPEPELLGV